MIAIGMGSGAASQDLEQTLCHGDTVIREDSDGGLPTDLDQPKGYVASSLDPRILPCPAPLAWRDELLKGAILG